MTKKESLQDAISDVEVQVKADAVKLEQEVVDEVKTVVKKVRAKKAPAANTAAQ